MIATKLSNWKDI